MAVTLFTISTIFFTVRQILKQFRLQGIQILQHLGILFQGCPESVHGRVVVNACPTCHVAQCGQFQHILQTDGILFGPAIGVQEHSQLSRFGVLGQGENLFETWDSLGDFGFGTDTGQVERVECHLRGRFTNTLGSNDPDHFTRMHFRVQEPSSHFIQTPGQSIGHIGQLSSCLNPQQCAIQQDPKHLDGWIDGYRRVVGVFAKLERVDQVINGFHCAGE